MPGRRGDIDGDVECAIGHPSTLVSLRNISKLSGIARTQSGFRIGAMTRHHVVAESAIFEG
ncbi:MAG: CO/xanthine dehydrogenase FAD-binding subunit [Gammaproteobacteria bacterium]|jgi:CO/xanthine dehydrogenase FAD-binding subunit